MSYGNLNDQGGKGTDAIWQRAVLNFFQQIIGTGSAPNNSANFVAGESGAITGTLATVVIAAPAAGSLYIQSLLVTNSHATQGTLVSLTDGSGNPILGGQGYAAPAGGRYSITFPTPIKVPVKTALYAICGTIGANVYVSAVGYKA